MTEQGPFGMDRETRLQTLADKDEIRAVLMR